MRVDSCKFEVAIRVTGDSKISIDKLRKYLTEKTWRVYRYLLSLRNSQTADAHAYNTGEVHPCLENVARRLKLPDYEVRRSVAKLRTVGLISATRERTGPLPGNEKVKARFFTVYGGDVELYYGQREPVEAYIPAETAKWFVEHKRGGVRPGAGRKVKPVIPHTESTSTNTAESSTVAAQEITGKESNPHAEGNQTRTPIFNPDLNSYSSVPTGRAERSLITTKNLRTPPPFPGNDLIKSARIPVPQKFPPSATQLELARGMLKAYRSGVQHYYGETSYKLTKRSAVKDFDGEVLYSVRDLDNFELINHPLYPRLVDTAEALRAESISPISWVAFCIRKWNFDDSHKEPPPLPSVLSTSSIVKHREWFYEQDEVQGGKVIFTKEEKELYLRWRTMSRELYCDMSPEEVDAVVTKHFPAGTYERLLRVARAAVSKTQQTIQDKINCGVWVW
jgi:hypothetical protein